MRLCRFFSLTSFSFSWYLDPFFALLPTRASAVRCGGSSVDDADYNLIPRLVDKLVIPQITDFVDFAFDPSSSRSTQTCVALLGVRRVNTTRRDAEMAEIALYRIVG